MSTDNTRFHYLSSWDIDQLVDEDTVAVSAGTNLIATVSGDPSLPVSNAQFQPTGSSHWYDEGTSSTDGTLANTFVFYTYLSGLSFYAVVPTGGIIRYFRWQDKVDY